ncbi:MAG: M48 family metalloprotease [Rickettsiaceae bacterium]|nr:M48 family metalloprotease [Rickettsiaceae bacterium]
MRKLNLIFLLLLFTNITTTNAGLIRDSEIEEAINLTVDPLIKAAKLENLKIHIIDDPMPNAYTPGKNTIFITTGLIINFPDPDVLRGVIAHEIGHIKGHHVTRQKEIIQNYNIARISTMALGLAVAMSGAGGAEAGLPIFLGGEHFAERSILSYSREFESSADQAALRLLEKSGHSCIGLINFFQNMYNRSSNVYINPYEQSHPLSKDRLLVLQSFNKRSQYPKSMNSTELKFKFSKSAAKLAGFTLDEETANNLTFSKEYNQELTRYIKTIQFFKRGKFDDAINNITQLIIKRPDDPFYHELKGQILFEAGKAMAINEYNEAIKLRPRDTLMKLGRAIVGFNKYHDKPLRLTEFYRDLVYVAKHDPDNLLALFYLSKFYEKRNLTGKSLLNSALINYKLGNRKIAHAQAKEAKKHLDKRSPDWYKADDILQSTKKENK